MPFRRATKELKYFTKVEVSESTARRITEQAGSDQVEVQSKEVEELVEKVPPSPPGPELQLISVDGAMVHVVSGDWVEVRTLAIGEVEPTAGKGRTPEPHTRNLSYFSRLSEASEFNRQALVEVFRRGSEKAGKVCAVTDGAEWEQKFIDYHRSDAVRILDFAHAAGKVAESGRVVLGEDTPEFKEWFSKQRHALKIGDTDGVLRRLRRLDKKARGRGRRKKLETIWTSINYLEKRREMIKYDEFKRLGYPIGSGCVESANKLVVESRMKQAGMRWAPHNVDPMLALRNIACNDRWEEAWSQLVRNRLATISLKHKQPSATLSDSDLAPPIQQAVSQARQKTDRKSLLELSDKPRRNTPYRPGADHLWRRMPFGSARYRTPDGFTRPKS